LGIRPLVDLRDLVSSSGETDFQAFDFAEPTLSLGFGDARGKVVADVDKAVSLVGVRPEHGASNAPLTELATAGIDPIGADGQ